MESNCCDIHQKLAEDFSTLARLYSETVVTLTSSRNLTPPEYARLCGVVEKAKERAEEASMQFEEHVEKHRCGLTDHRAHRLAETFRAAALTFADDTPTM
jgi:hypothetical protein